MADATQDLLSSLLGSEPSTPMWAQSKRWKLSRGETGGWECLVAGPRLSFSLYLWHHDRYFGWTVGTLLNHTQGSLLLESGRASDSAFEGRVILRLLLFQHGQEEDGIFFPVCGQCILADVLGVPRQDIMGQQDWFPDP